MSYYISNKMIKKVNFVHLQGHAKINAISALELELFEQKYNRVPDVVEIWDFDDDIKRWAEIFCDWILHYLFVTELLQENKTAN